MNKLFQIHMLNTLGKAKAGEIAYAFQECLSKLCIHCPDGREMSIIKTKLEEACFFAKKAMAQQPENQQNSEL